MDSKNPTKEVWWKPAIVLFIGMSFWIAGPIVIAMLVAGHFGLAYSVSPKGFIGLMILSFLISITAIVRITKRYIYKLEKEAREKKQNNPQ